MTRAIHGLHTPLSAFNVKYEHICLLMLGMPRDFPKVQVEYIGCNYLLVTSVPVLLANEVNEIVVHTSTMRESEARARGQSMKEEKLLFNT